MFRILNLSMLFLLLLLRPAAAQLKDENFLVQVPPGYKIDFREQNAKMLMTEMVPTNETVKNWTEMVTMQVFFGLKVQPEAFQVRMQQIWGESCPGSEFRTLAKEVESGYAVAVWLQICPSNKATGKPEITLLKAVLGNDSLYVLQKAFKFKPSQEQVTKWMAYLRDARVCDSRIPERACPAVKSN